MEGAIRVGVFLILAVLLFVLRPLTKNAEGAMTRPYRLSMIGQGLLYIITLVTVLLDLIGLVQVPWLVRATLIAATLLYQGVLIVFFWKRKRERQRNAVPSGK